MRSVGWPTPTGTLWPSLPQVPTPESSAMSLPIIETRIMASGPLPISVAPLTGVVILLGGEINAQIQQAASSPRSRQERDPQPVPASAT